MSANDGGSAARNREVGREADNPATTGVDHERGSRDTAPARNAARNRDATLLGQAKDLAESIFDQYERWERDQDEPPSLRDGARHPGDMALRLARVVRHIPEDS